MGRGRLPSGASRLILCFVVVFIVTATVRWDAHRPRVLIRWSAGVSAAQRADLENRFAIDRQGGRADGRTFEYRLRRWARQDLRAIVEHAAVEDTSDIDRPRFRLENEPASRLAHTGLSLLLAATLSALLVSLVPVGAWHPLAAAYLCMVLVVSTFAMQFSTFTQLSNDHSGYLAMARQIVLGEWPVRDFLDHGTFLHSLVSAGLQRLFGHQLLAEMAFSAGLMAAGYCLTFLLAARLTRSNLAGFALALSCVLTTPRPYSYPKIFIYPLAIWLVCSYLRRPSSRQLAGLGLAAAGALMMRFDHGVVVIGAATALVFLRTAFESSGGAIRSVARLLLWFAVGLSPFLAYLMLTAGPLEYVAMTLEFGQRALVGTDAFQLHLLNLSPVATTSQVVVAFIHDSYLAITVAAVGGVAWRTLTEVRAVGAPGVLTLELAAGVAVWLAAAPVLIRSTFVARFADVAPILALLGAGLVATIAEPLARGDAMGVDPVDDRRRAMVRAVAGVIVVAVLLGPAVRLREGTLRTIEGYQTAVVDFVAMARVFAESPPRGVLDENLRRIVGFVEACTEPDDRLLATWYAPEIYFASNRRFAGNQWVYVNYRNSVLQQQEVIGLLGQQSVPLVFVRADDPLFGGVWPLLADHVQGHYAEIGMLGGAVVYAETRRDPIRRDPESGLPCFAAAHLASMR